MKKQSYYYDHKANARGQQRRKKEVNLKRPEKKL